MIFIGDYQLEVDGEYPIAITKEPFSLSEFDQRSGDYAKQFGIVGNAEANKAFSQYFEATHYVTGTDQFAPDFNPNKKASISIWDGNNLVMSGYCKLDEIKLIRKKIVYMVTAYSGLSQLADELGDKRLTDLDLSSFNHAWTEANVSASWNNTYADGYVYPAVTYGDKTDLTYWKWTDYKPALFAKAIWDKIFEEHNWSYVSDFLNTHHFEKRIIPNPNWSIGRDATTVNKWTFTVGNSSSYSIDNDQVNISRSGSTAPAAASRFEFPTDTGSVLSNALQNTDTTEWDTTNHLYTAANDLTAAFRFYFDGSMVWEGPSKSHAVSTGVGPPARWLAMSASVAIVRRRGGVNRILEIKQFEANFSAKTVATSASHTIDSPVNFETQPYDLIAGDEIYMVLHRANWLSKAIDPVFGSVYTEVSEIIADGDMRLDVSGGSIFGIVIDTSISVGQTLPVTRVLPDMSQREFIRAIALEYNLHYQQTDDKELSIEPWSDFRSSETDDWDDKLDRGSEHTLTPVSELNYKEYHFTYQEDDAVWNNDYRQSYRYEYGSKRKLIDTDFQTQVKEIRSPFASAVLVDYKNRHDMVVADISFRNSDGLPIINEDPKPRLLYYGGLVSCKAYTYDNGTARISKTEYPYAGHLDNPVTPEFDYLWSNPKSIYYTRMYGGQDYPRYPNRNLYNRYWYRFIEDISSPNSRVFEGYFALTNSDVTDLTFRKLKWFNNAQWILLGIYDHDPTGKELTRCRLLLTGDTTDPTLSNFTLKYGYGETDPQDDPIPQMASQPPLDGNRWREKAYYGLDNQIGGRMGVVYGDANLVGTNVRGFSLLNASGNSVYASGAHLVNTDGRTVEKFNEVWVNNINYEQFVEITLGYAEMQAINSSPLTVLPTLDSNQYYDLTRATYRYENNGTPYTGDTNLQFRYSTTNTLHPLWHNVGSAGVNGALGTVDYARATSTDTSAITSTGVAVIWNTIDHQGVDIVVAAASPTITAQVAGTYKINPSVTYTSSDQRAQITLEIQVNGSRYTTLRGTGYIRQSDQGNWDYWPVEASGTLLELDAGDTVEVWAYEAFGSTYEPSDGPAACTLETATMNIERVGSNITGSSLLHGTTDGSSQFARLETMTSDLTLPMGESVQLYGTNDLSGDGGDVTFRLYYRVMET